MRLAFCSALLVTAATIAACSIDAEDAPDHHVVNASGDDATDEPIGSTSSALSASDPVSQATIEGCSGELARGIANQLVEEIQCLRPNTMKSLANTPGIVLVGPTAPWMQKPAADALIAAQKARGVEMRLNSTLRTIPEQYILYRWFVLKRCRNIVTLAAPPGQSNHESGLAIDVQDNAGWRSALQNNGFRWLGANDAVHYDYTGGGTVALNRLAVEAFQRLWNRNNPNDLIAVDGAYGPQTEARVAQSPLGGFKIGAQCNDPKPQADGGAPDADVSPTQPTPEPEPTEPAAPSATPEKASFPESEAPAATGCSTTPTEKTLPPSSMALFAFAAAALVRRRFAARATRTINFRS